MGNKALGVHLAELKAEFLGGIMTMRIFLTETEYIDYTAQAVRETIKELFTEDMSEIQKAEIAYKFVRDEIEHSFDCNATAITAKASDVLKYKTGICHAKANLLAALLRSQGIPTGFCFEHLTLANDDSMGCCLHAFNAVYLAGHWVKLDARGNKTGINAEFSIKKPVLAYPPRKEYNEYFFPGIYATPHKETMDMLEEAGCLQDVLDNIPEFITCFPDIPENN